MTAIVFTLIFFTLGPRVESAIYPAARGELIEWRDAGDEIEIVEAVIRKRGECSYLAMHARAGIEDLPIRFAQEFGSRPGGEFALSGVFIRKPITGAPIEIAVSVDHECWPFWVSRSRLFTIDY